jgi:spore photoproduct lyase
LENPEPIFFTNLKDLEKELTAVSKTKKYLRIGTGELSDSLALDRETNYSHKILTLFEKFPDMIFEFKTKSDFVDNLLDYQKCLKNIIISWSLNPQEIIQREERLAPNLQCRLTALKKVQKHGYKIGIHFDPLLIFKGWEEAYEDLILQIKQAIDPGLVAWWSLGALRFPYALRKHIFKHCKSRLFEGELIKGFDDKYRYFKPLRLELFRFITERIKGLISKDVPLYLCMEDREVWEEVLPGISPVEEVVNKYLYQSAIS